MNVFKIISLIQEFEPLIEEALNSPQGQALISEVVNYFNQHPVSATASQAVEQAVLPEVNVPPNTPVG